MEMKKKYTDTFLEQNEGMKKKRRKNIMNEN